MQPLLERVIYIALLLVVTSITCRASTLRGVDEAHDDVASGKGHGKKKVRKNDLDTWEWELVKPNALPFDPPMWAPRAGLQAAHVGQRSFSSTLLVMGGRTPLPPVDVGGAFPVPVSQLWNDVWRSDNNGRSWSEVTPSAPWPARAYFQGDRGRERARRRRCVVRVLGVDAVDVG